MQPWMPTPDHIIASCDTAAPDSEVSVYPIGGWSMLESMNPGAPGSPMTSHTP